MFFSKLLNLKYYNFNKYKIKLTNEFNIKVGYDEFFYIKEIGSIIYYLYNNHDRINQKMNYRTLI